MRKRPWESGIGVACLVILATASCTSAEEEQHVRQLLRDHAMRYPRMEAQDIYKLLHQAALGSEHAMSSPEAAREWLASEITQLSAGPDDPLIDPLRPDSMVVRVHLRPFLAQNGDTEALLGAFVHSSNTPVGSTRTLKRYLRYAARSSAAGEIPSDADAFTVYVAQQARHGYPPAHHSEAYVAAYAPAYRVITASTCADGATTPPTVSPHPPAQQERQAAPAQRAIQKYSSC